MRPIDIGALIVGLLEGVVLVAPPRAEPSLKSRSCQYAAPHSPSYGAYTQVILTSSLGTDSPKLTSLLQPRLDAMVRTASEF